MHLHPAKKLFYIVSSVDPYRAGQVARIPELSGIVKLANPWAAGLCRISRCCRDCTLGKTNVVDVGFLPLLLEIRWMSKQASQTFHHTGRVLDTGRVRGQRHSGEGTRPSTAQSPRLQQ